MALILLVALLALAAGTFGLLLARARARIGGLEGERATLDTRLVAAQETRLVVERDLATMQERVAAAERRNQDFERLRQESLHEAKAAVYETAQKLSSQLIDEHKRESEAAKKEGEERVRLASEHLVKQVGEIAKSVAELSGQVQEKGRTIDAVVRSLSSPGGAGQIAEIGLANSLKAMGLELGRDYVLQATTADEVSGQRLRPDALVFLPGNNLLIIDCKASKFLMEIAETEGGEGEGAAYASLGRTMNTHLKALTDKNYRAAVQSAWRESGRGGELGHVHSVMYLPNEGALEKLGRADPAFLAKAHAASIIPAGPTGLHAMLCVAAAEISRERQEENHKAILEGAQALLDSLTVALLHVGAVGKNIRGAAEAFAKLSGSVNQRLLPRARRIAALGVKPDRPLPASLPAYTVVSQEADQLIEGEASEVPEQPSLPRLLAE